MVLVKKKILWFGSEIEVYEQQPTVLKKIVDKKIREKKVCLWCHKPLDKERTYFCSIEHSKLFRDKLRDVTNRFYFSSNYSEQRDKLIREGERYV
jgi:hypothetical protein